MSNNNNNNIESDMEDDEKIEIDNDKYEDIDMKDNYNKQFILNEIEELNNRYMTKKQRQIEDIGIFSTPSNISNLIEIYNDILNFFISIEDKQFRQVTDTNKHSYKIGQISSETFIELKGKYDTYTDEIFRNHPNKVISSYAKLCFAAGVFIFGEKKYMLKNVLLNIYRDVENIETIDPQFELIYNVVYKKIKIIKKDTLNNLYLYNKVF